MVQAPLTEQIPTAPDMRERIGIRLRELRLARRLLSVAKLADAYRGLDVGQDDPMARSPVREAVGVP